MCGANAFEPENIPVSTYSVAYAQTEASGEVRLCYGGMGLSQHGAVELTVSFCPVEKKRLLPRGYLKNEPAMRNMLMQMPKCQDEES